MNARKHVDYYRFEPDAPVARQDIAAIFARYAEYQGLALADSRGYAGFVDQAEIAAYAGFVDQAEIAAYAAGSVEVLYAVEVVNCYPDGSFRQLVEATRAEVAAMLRRLCEGFA